MPPVTLHADWWNVYCQKCPWKKLKLGSQEAARGMGKAHSEQKHPEDFEYRVQGVKRNRD